MRACVRMCVRACVRAIAYRAYMTLYVHHNCVHWHSKIQYYVLPSFVSAEIIKKTITRVGPTCLGETQTPTFGLRHPCFSQEESTVS